MGSTSTSASQQAAVTRLVRGGLAVLVTLTLLGGLILYWQVVAPEHPALAVPGVIVALLALTIRQSLQALLAEDWLRRAAAMAVPVGVVATLLGVHPGAVCAAAAAGPCRPAGPNPILAGVGVLATVVPVYLDHRWWSIAREADPTA